MSYSLIDCNELNGTRTESYGMPLTGQSQVTLRCTWANSINLVADILDNRRSDPLHIGLLASAATVKAAGGENASGYTGAGQVITPEWAEVTITYGYLTAEEQSANPTGDPNAEWYTETFEPTLEFTTLDHRDFQWGSGSPGIPLKPEEAPGRLMPGAKLVRNWRNLTTLPAGIVSLMGKVNDVAYTSPYLGLTLGAETLLYQPPALTRTITRAGSSTWSAKLAFHYKEQTWNKFWHTAAKAYVSMYIIGSGPPLEEYKNHEAADLSSLLT